MVPKKHIGNMSLLFVTNIRHIFFTFTIISLKTIT